jgi:hypothetical protein
MVSQKQGEWPLRLIQTPQAKLMLTGKSNTPTTFKDKLQFFQSTTTKRSPVLRQLPPQLEPPSPMLVEPSK